MSALVRLLNLLEELNIIWDELIMEYARDIVEIVVLMGIFFGFFLVGVTYTIHLSHLSDAEAILLFIVIYTGYYLLGFYLAFRVAVYRAIKRGTVTC